MKKKFFILPLIFFLLILLSFLYILVSERDPYNLPCNLINRNVPIFETDSLFKNEKFSSKQKFGEEIILVNFFATWCKPCHDEHKYIMDFANKEKIKVIGINYKDNDKKVKEFLKKLGNPYSEIAIDRKGRIAIDWGVYGIPETFIVNSEGVIKYRHAGQVTKKIYKKINSILNEISNVK